MRFLFSCILLVLSVCCVAQPRNIDSLKKQLPLLRDSAKAECLLRIAGLYVNDFEIHTDSGLVYAKRAYDFAKLQGNKLQQGKSAYLRGKICLQSSRVSEGLTYYRELLKLGEEVNSREGVAFGARGIGEALWYSGQFADAIKYIELAIVKFEALGWTWHKSQALISISNIYGDEGNYEKAFEWNRKALDYSTGTHDSATIVLAMVEMGKLYRNIGDYKAAMEYYKKSMAYKPLKGAWGYRYLQVNMGDLYCDLKQYDSAYVAMRNGFLGHSDGKTARMKIGRYFQEIQNYDSAMYYYKGLCKDLRNSGEINIYIVALLGVGKVYLQLHNTALALEYGQKAMKLAESRSSKINVRDACKLLYQVYEQMGQPGISFRYYKRYVTTQDSIITNQFKGKLYEFQRIAEEEKSFSQIERLKWESLSKDQRLKKNRFLRNLLAGGIFLVIILGVITIWSISLKRKNDKLKSDKIRSTLEHKTTELEMQALRAQMNPHFIFNCLSSINRFILKNEADKASDYLTRFARLIRLVLVNSQKTQISLEEELQMLRLYIEMEQLRFKDSFVFNISYEPEVELNNTAIPPLLLQPFCENAIWHGLMHKEGEGILNISFKMQGEALICNIVDNGIGRAKAAGNTNHATDKVKSLGLKLTTERLALFNDRKKQETFYDISDVIDEQRNVAGTRVTIIIKRKNTI